MDSEDQRAIARLSSFSDGVFAFAVTLLVLGLEPPSLLSEDAFWRTLNELAPRFIVFAASFALVLVFWAAHVTTLRRLIMFDWLTAWLNGLFLLTIALLPFASSMLGQSAVFVLSWRLYGAILVAASMAQTLLVLSVTRDNGRLMGGCDWRERTRRVMRSLSPGAAFALSIFLSLRGAQLWSLFAWALIPIIMFLTQALFGPRRQNTGAP